MRSSTQGNTTNFNRLRMATGAVAIATSLVVGSGVLVAAAAPAEAAAAAASNRSDGDRAGLRTGPVERLVKQLRRTGAVGINVEIRSGPTIWSTAAGNARVDPRQPAKPGARFRAGSVTKQLVSVLTLQLVEKDTWTLDTTLGEIAPDLWPGQEAVTVRQLLSHTSGLPEYLTPLVAEATTTAAFLDAIDDRWRDQDLIALAQQQPATSPPGTFSYSNTNYVVLGELLRRTTGRSVPSLAERRVLRPAGMSDSYFADDRSLPAPRLGEYARFPGRLLGLGRFQPSMFSSAGSLVSTASDLNDFHAALESGQLMPRRYVRTMQREVAPKSGYALGSYPVEGPCGLSINGHDGATWGTLTFSFAAGRSTLVTVAMTGRSYRLAQYRKQLVLIQRLVIASFAATCPGPDGGDAEGRAAGSPWPLPDLTGGAFTRRILR